MTTPRRIFRINRFPVALVAALLALLGSLAPPVSAQDNPGSLLATQFFGSLTGEEASYQLSPDAVLHTPEGDYAGHAGIATYGDALAASFTYLEFSIGEAVQAGNSVIVSLTITGINTGSYHNLAANCAGITVPAVAVLRVSEQVVVEQWIDYDREHIASQISAVNLMDPRDRPGCAAEYVLAQEGETAPAGLPPTSPLPPTFENPY